MRALLLVVVIAGCGRDAPSCAIAAAQNAQALHGTADRTAAMIASCEQERWSGEMRSCIAAAGTEMAVATCYINETKEKRTRPGALPEVTPRPRLEIAMRPMTTFTNEMCQCQTRACGDAIQERMTKWAEQMARQHDPDSAEHPDPETIKRMTELVERYTECITKVMVPAN